MSGANYSGDPETLHPLSRTIAQNDSDSLVLDPRRTFAGAKTSRMTHYDLDSKCRARHAFSGRSMIEMLGVLAIIGVLSVGGIAGFNKAMMEYKITKNLNQYGELFQNIFTHEKQLRRIVIENGGERRIGNDLKQLNILPEGWEHSYDGMTDPLGIFSYVTSRGKLYYAINKENQLTFETHVKSPYRHKGTPESKIEFSQRFITDILKPLSAKINNLVLSYPNVIYYGDNTTLCKEGTRPCLKDLTITEINELWANTCRQESEEWCTFSISF